MESAINQLGTQPWISLHRNETQANNLNFLRNYIIPELEKRELLSIIKVELRKDHVSPCKQKCQCELDIKKKVKVKKPEDTSY